MKVVSIQDFISQRIYLIIFILITAFIVSACLSVNTPVNVDETAIDKVVTSTQNPGTTSLQEKGKLYLSTPALPDTVADAQPDWDYFSWNTFIAMNWPALEAIPDQY